jgi:hypothetical protein
VTAGDAAFVLTVNGTHFNSSSIVRFNGSDRSTTFVNSSQLTAQITAADLPLAGTRSITVFNPAPGGGSSSGATFTVNNPTPSIGTLSPPSYTAGDTAFVLAVSGTNFVDGSVVRFNGSDRTTTFVNATHLTTQITAADVQAADAFPVSVFNPAPGGGSSSAVTFTVNNPTPSISTVSPPSYTAGDTAFVLAVSGTNFVNDSVVRFNGSDRTTTFVNATQLTAQITAADMQAAGAFPITVFNPAPGGGTTTAFDFIVNNPIATVSTLSPASKTAGDAAFVLTVNGANFVASSVVEWNGSSRRSRRLTCRP